MKPYAEDDELETKALLRNGGLIFGTRVLLDEYSKEIYGIGYKELPDDLRYDLIRRIISNNEDGICSPYKLVHTSLYANMVVILYAYLNTPMSENRLDDLVRAANFAINSRLKD